MNNGTHPTKGFHISNRAHYAGVIDRPEIMIGLYYPQGGCEAEFAIRWYDLGGRYRSTAKVEVFDDAWGMFFNLTELRSLAEFTKKPVHQQQIIDFLLASGYTDLTRYEASRSGQNLNAR